MPQSRHVLCSPIIRFCLYLTQQSTIYNTLFSIKLIPHFNSNAFFTFWFVLSLSLSFFHLFEKKEVVIRHLFVFYGEKIDCDNVLSVNETNMKSNGKRNRISSLIIPEPTQVPFHFPVQSYVCSTWQSKWSAGNKQAKSKHKAVYIIIPSDSVCLHVLSLFLCYFIIIVCYRKYFHPNHKK